MKNRVHSRWSGENGIEKNVRKLVCLISVLSLVLFLLTGWLCAGSGERVLEQVEKLLAEDDYVYGEPERLGKTFSEHKHLPAHVVKYIYWKDKGKNDLKRVDYYKPPGLFRKERYIITELFLGDEKDKVYFVVWIDREKENEIQRIEKHIPPRTVERSDSLEKLRAEYVYYDKNGELLNRIVEFIYLDHSKLSATFTREEKAPDGSVIKVSSGDADYDGFVCPPDNPHCN